MSIELSDEERDVLKKVLTTYLGNLREEIYKTESHMFKPPLKREEEVIKAIMRGL